MNWEYGKAYEKHPISPGEIAIWKDGSSLRVHDIYGPVPEEYKKADLVFTDTPWNLGNLRSFYTKADRSDYPDDFPGFYARVFHYIREINPETAYTEIGKEYLPEFVLEMRKLYKYVTFYSTTYYHSQKNKCFIVRGSRRAKKPDYDWMDEEDVISRIGEEEAYSCICDPCMGRGLVAVAAYKTGHQFVGGELNPRRLSVALSKLPGYWLKKPEKSR